MFKNTTLVALCLLVFAYTTKAQDPDWGRTTKAEKSNYSPKVVGEDDRSLYMVDIIKSEKLLFEKFDKKSLSRKYSNEVELPNARKNKYVIEEVSFINDQFIVFTSSYSRSPRKYELSAFLFDSKNGRFDRKELLYSNEVEKKYRKGDFNVVTSKNNQTFVFTYNVYSKDKDNTTSIVRLFDGNIKELVSREVIYDGKQSFGNSANFQLDDEGSLYYVGDNELVILDANSNYEEWKEPIVVPNLAANARRGRTYLSINSTGDPVLVGTYVTVDTEKTDENKRRRDRRKNDEQVEGMFFMRINGFSKETEASAVTEFSKDFIDQFRTNKDVKKNRDSEVNEGATVARFYYKEDGGVVFLTERQVYMNYYDNQGALTGQRFEYGDVVVYNFSPDGTMSWANRIPKEQAFFWQRAAYGIASMGSYGVKFFSIPFYMRGHLSYLAGVTDDEFVVYYNDTERNMKLKKISEQRKTMSNVKNSVPIMIAFNMETGERKVEKNLRLHNKETKLKPVVHYQRNQKEPLYIFAMRKKNFRFGKIDFNEENDKRKKRR